MKVLWFSRHTMTEEQEADLRTAYGSDLEVKQVSTTATSVQDVIQAGADCDVLAVVLPIGLIGELTNPRVNSKPVLQARSNRVKTGNKTSTGEDEFMFVHAGWQVVEKVEVITRPLLG